MGNPNDPWNLSTSAYDASNFYTRATDGNGHDAVLQSKISPALMGELQRLVQSRAIPQYKTYADVIRDALVHRLRYLHDEFDAGTINLHALEVEQRQAEIDRVLTDRQTWDKLLKDLDTLLDKLVGANELDEADWIIEMNEWNESMTPPYLVRLSKCLSKHRQAVDAARKDMQ